jgi:PAS domain S-box-containing protein
MEPLLPIVVATAASPGPSAWLALVALAAALAGAVVVLIFGIVATRRRLTRESRQIVQVLEEIRSGKSRRRSEVGTASPLANLSDAVNRLGHEIHGRWSEAESTAERWRALIDASEDIAVITTDTDGDIRSFSAGASNLFGWDEDEVLSRPAAVVFDEDAYKDLLPMLARRTLRKQGVTTRSTLLRRDSTSFPAEVGVRLLTGATAQPVGFMMVVRDITQQLQLEGELRGSEERYRSLVEGLGEGVLILQQGRLSYANPAAASLCERPAKELEGMCWRELVATADVLVAEEAFSALEGQSGAREDLRLTLVGRDGTPCAEVRIAASAMEYAGRPAVLLLVQDETLERRMRTDLHRNETRLDAVLEATSDGIVVISDPDEGSVVQMTNRAFADLFMLRIPEFLGKPERLLQQLLRRKGGGAVEVAERMASASEAPSRRITLASGEAPQRDLTVTVAPLAGRGGEDLGRIVVCRDVTEQRRSERQLQEQAQKLQASKVELEESYRELNEVTEQLRTRGEDLDRLNQELRRLDDMKSNLLGNVSHELQTPLVSIRGYTEMILKERLGPISEEQRKGLQLSLKNIDRLIAMIDNLLAFTRTDPGVDRLRLTRFALKPLLDEALELLREKIDDKKVRVSTTLRDESLEIQADRDKVLQVFLNLLSNAVKFNREQGSIEIAALAGRSGYATVRVRDEGIGIPHEALGRIFDRHFQAHSGHEASEGSGIGLAIVRDILRQHGCTIQVDSEQGRGAEFTFTLPMVRLNSEPVRDDPPADFDEGPPLESEQLTPAESRGASPDDRDHPPRLRIIRRRSQS